MIRFGDDFGTLYSGLGPNGAGDCHFCVTKSLWLSSRLQAVRHLRLSKFKRRYFWPPIRQQTLSTFVPDTTSSRTITALLTGKFILTLRGLNVGGWLVDVEARMRFQTRDHEVNETLKRRLLIRAG
jgi:hypothetical protein